MPKNSQFEKFINPKKNSVIKEEKKQEKRAYKKKKAAAINEYFEEKRRKKAETSGSGFTGSKSGRGIEPRKSKPGSAPESRGSGSRVGKSQASGDAAPTESPRSKSIGNGKSQGAGSSPNRALRASGDAASTESRKPGPAAKPAPREPESGRGAKAIPAGAAAGLKQPANAILKLMPLNKYIAHSGVCSRRDAADLVKQGDVNVNGTVIKEPGYKVADTDIVKVKGKKITPSRDFVYILLNKPKDYITTSDDPEGRRTVMELIRKATNERVYPIGRLDRNTSGVLLFTNDGELAQILSHPRHEIKKIYEVKLDKPLTKSDFDKIINGLTLEDGFIAPDVLAYADTKDKSVIGIEIHSGRNRIVRRIFEHLQYDVRGLDRVMYAGLTKKNVQRGNWRLLTEREIRTLKHFNKKEKSK